MKRKWLTSSLWKTARKIATWSRDRDAPRPLSDFETCHQIAESRAESGSCFPCWTSKVRPPWRTKSRLVHLFISHASGNISGSVTLSRPSNLRVATASWFQSKAGPKKSVEKAGDCDRMGPRFATETRSKIVARERQAS